MSGDDCLPILGLANVGLRTSDLDKARAFYSGTLGFDEAFDTKGADGAVTAVYFKVGDRQFIEISPGLKPNDVVSMSHIAFRTENIERLRTMMLARGLAPTEIQTRPDGNLGFSLGSLPAQELDHLEFVQYVPGSLSEATKGKLLSERRLSDHLEHAGIVVTNFTAAYEFYAVALGFRDRYMRFNYERSKVVLDQLRSPGPNEEFVELFNFEGLSAPLVRKLVRGPVHLALTVPDDAALFQETVKRGVSPKRPPPRYAWDDRYNTNLFDPDGTRIEFMQVEDKGHPTPLVVYTPQAGAQPGGAAVK